MEVHVTKLPAEKFGGNSDRVYDLNILNKEEIVSLLFEARPDYIFHLAAQSSVGMAWKNPLLTIDINIKGSVNVFLPSLAFHEDNSPDIPRQIPPLQ